MSRFVTIKSTIKRAGRVKRAALCLARPSARHAAVSRSGAPIGHRARGARPSPRPPGSTVCGPLVVSHRVTRGRENLDKGGNDQGAEESPSHVGASKDEVRVAPREHEAPAACICTCGCLHMHLQLSALHRQLAGSACTCSCPPPPVPSTGPTCAPHSSRGPCPQTSGAIYTSVCRGDECCEPAGHPAPIHPAPLTSQSL